jgi:nitroreductase
MDVCDAIAFRRSIRDYQDNPVEDEKLKKILEAGRLAPSASNRQEWHFVIVKDRELRNRLMKATGDQKFVGQAPVVIAACAVDSSHVMRCGQPSYSIDVAIALSFMNLQATELGLGCCWIGRFEEPQVKKILKIPDEVRVVQLMTLGYFKENPPPKPRKSSEEIASHDYWGQKSSR